LPPHQGDEEILFSTGEYQGEKDRYFGKSGKIREVIELLLLHLREVNSSILSHTSR